ncbi:complex 4-like [Octopus vulgaris]|uniref:Elongator complex protein 4 n=1 Tax=Octopus vulgaris TaxID=6645 RepID=A0AA36BVQ9_OCTVU|nr:complex 4-like [Octopus vulgaris]
MATASFSKNKSSQRSRVLQIPGTKPSLFNHQLLVSSGVPSFDNLLGGGIAVGSLVLIEEDTFGHYGQLLLKYFLSEAVMTGQSILLAGTEGHPQSVLKELPKPIVDDVTPAQSNMMQTDEMKIAWRYQHLNKYQSNPTAVKFGHYYDLSQYMDEDLVSSADVTLITSQQLSQQHLHEEPPGIEPTNLEMSACLQSLLLNIQQHIQDGQFGTQDQPEKHNVLRIAIPSLGSPLWGNLKTSESDGLLSIVDTDLLRFLLALRAILRSSFAVCMVTVPSLIMEDANFIHKIERLCDTVVHLESFAGSSRSENPLYKEYHGLFHVKQLPKLNAIKCQMPDTTDWAFKLRRKKFVIEKLHLPPDLSETVSRSESRPGTMGCGSTGHRHLDF